MLVLSRKYGERIRIGKDIWIQVVEIRPGIVRFGVTAPKDQAIAREELLPVDERFFSELPAVVALEQPEHAA